MATEAIARIATLQGFVDRLRAVLWKNGDVRARSAIQELRDAVAEQKMQLRSLESLVARLAERVRTSTR